MVGNMINVWMKLATSNHRIRISNQPWLRLWTVDEAIIICFPERNVIVINCRLVNWIGSNDIKHRYFIHHTIERERFYTREINLQVTLYIAQLLQSCIWIVPQNYETHQMFWTKGIYFLFCWPDYGETFCAIVIGKIDGHLIDWQRLSTTRLLRDISRCIYWTSSDQVQQYHHWTNLKND